MTTVKTNAIKTFCKRILKANIKRHGHSQTFASMIGQLVKNEYLTDSKDLTKPVCIIKANWKKFLKGLPVK